MTDLFIEDKIHDECGVFGIFGNDTTDIIDETYLALYALQHRGTLGAGIAINDNGNMSVVKGFGVVPEALPEKELSRLKKAKIALGHVRHTTASVANDRTSIQPLLMRYVNGQLSLALNGALTNYSELREHLHRGGAIFQSNSDIEVIAYIIAQERLKTASIEEAVLNAMDKIKGAYSMVMMAPSRLIGVRDPRGFRPLCIGKLGENYIITSESCVFDSLGGEFVRDVEPGEMVVIDDEGVHSYKNNCGGKTSLCLFEFVYFARPDSVLDGMCVNIARQRAGVELAKEHPVEADMVCAVPDCGIDAAIGYSMQSGIQYGVGLVKNRFIGRAHNNRKKHAQYNLRIKLNAMKSNVQGKRIVLIDDSIVKGETSKHIVSMLKKAGAKEVHLRISSPPFKYPCYFGTDIDSTDNLIAAHKSIDEMCAEIGADSLGFLSIDGLHRIADECKIDFCDACFSGDYPIEASRQSHEDKYSKKL
ncbi:amidophosphoribosyltransferase [Pseudoruminococcus massiliensis]|jgi:amidophosphoribosyltransferase|uniref:amidophosphoribosyltransferase n=1 Tax=Pseudoruminococcus massiliensis TaxID=2086583 RepID=UPI0022E86D6F|nr:amidophosphoribosyltransferase [Pseudoruminococcus massiliensis]